MFPFRETERRASLALHGAPVFPLSAEGVRRVAVPCEVFPSPTSPACDLSTDPSSLGSRLSHGARRDPTVHVGLTDTSFFLVNPSRAGDKSHRDGTGTTACRID